MKNKGDTMKKQTLEDFIKNGGKVELLPAQKSKIKYINKVKTCYSQGRIRWQYQMERELPKKIA